VQRDVLIARSPLHNSRELLMSTSSAIHSNAFNFLSFMLHGVDPRTGQYTVSVDIPELKSNHLCGPAVPLQLQFSPLNTTDSGYGLGWNLNLSQYTPGDQMVALSTGERFKVTGSGTQPAIKEKKLDSFHFYDEGNDTYRVVHKSGLIEVLHTGGSAANRIALPRQILAPSGHSVSLTYATFNGGQLLETISDAYGTLLRIERDSNDGFVKLHLHPDKGADGAPLATFEMTLTGNGTVSQIILPTPERASWRFQYEQVYGMTCLKEVQTPVGGRETIEYLDAGHLYPGPVREALPRVTRHSSYPGFNQPMIDTTYTYTHFNFIGYGAPIQWADDGLDNLYKAPVGYEYGSVATLKLGGVTLQTVTRTFNRFHLLTKEVTAQGNCIKTMTTEYHALDVSFDEQPPQFQMPKSVTTTWTLQNDPTRSRSQTQSTTFDEHGNLAEQVQANGIRDTFTYYAKEGEEGCPPDPQGFVRHQKEKTTIPGTSEQGEALTLRTRYHYEALPSLAIADAPNWLVLSEEVLTSSADAHARPLQSIKRGYFNQPADAALHGLLASESETLNGLATGTAFTYSKLLNGLAGETVQQVQETLTGFDGEQKVVTRQHSLLNGEVLLDYDNDTHVQISYAYDPLERVVRETVAPGTEFEASRFYSYLLTSAAGQQASQEATNVNGVITRTRVDGLNRTIYEERQDADATQPGLFRRTYAASHDVLGNLVEETLFDWLRDTELALRSTYEYDDWGERSCVVGPDGVREFSIVDPIGTLESKGAVMRSWRQGPALDAPKEADTETWYNLFDKPTRIERFNSLQQSLSVARTLYDGLGRIAQEIDAREASTRFGYDAFGRVTETVLADESVVKRSYALHGADDLPISISVNDIELGTQEFDGLGRCTNATTGGRSQTFSYDPGRMQPASVTMPDAQLIGYDYQPLLNDRPSRRYLPSSLTSRYDYDKKNSRLLGCHEADQELTRSYFSTGEMKSESRRQAQGELLTMHYVYSRQARLLEYTDVLGQVQHYSYDRAGRLESTGLGGLRSGFVYDVLGRLAEIHTVDAAQMLDVSLEYDDLGREKLRTFNLNGVVQTLDQSYNAVDALESRTLKLGSEVLRAETFAYDPRGRLERYTCSGSQPPVDPYGQEIQQQVFAFDALDNMTLVLTTSPGGTDRARFIYDQQDPVQLRSITHTGNANYPPEIVLDYDANGNLVSDEQQRILTYDALGRLLTVQESSGVGQSAYHYDAMDRLAGEGAENDQRFYREDDLANRLRGTRRSTFVRGAGQLLAEKNDESGTGGVLLACDPGQTVLAEALPGEASNDIGYSVYGWRNPSKPAATELGFNGQLNESGTAWQMLGNGYRAFNPALMRFNSPDNLSPFGGGGLNAYMYCAGDPVNQVDPSGHNPLGIFSGLMLMAGVGSLIGAAQVKDRDLQAALQIIGFVMLVVGVTGGIGSGMVKDRAASSGEVGKWKRWLGIKSSTGQAQEFEGSARWGRRTAVQPTKEGRPGLQPSARGSGQGSPAPSRRASASSLPIGDNSGTVAAAAFRKPPVARPRTKLPASRLPDNPEDRALDTANLGSRTSSEQDLTEAFNGSVMGGIRSD
jgi:RHS repeat-associated protein